MLLMLFISESLSFLPDVRIELSHKNPTVKIQ